MVFDINIYVTQKYFFSGRHHVESGLLVFTSDKQKKLGS